MLLIFEEILQERKQRLDSSQKRTETIFTESVILRMVGRLAEQNKCPIRFVKRNHSNVISSTRTSASEQTLHKVAREFAWIVERDMGVDMNKGTKIRQIDTEQRCFSALTSLHSTANALANDIDPSGRCRSSQSMPESVKWRWSNWKRSTSSQTCFHIDSEDQLYFPHNISDVVKYFSRHRYHWAFFRRQIR